MRRRCVADDARLRAQARVLDDPGAARLRDAAVRLDARDVEQPLRHGPPLGLSNVAWVKYGDWQPESIKRNQERAFGIDAPWHVQYLRYLGSVARFDFGQTFTFRSRTVNSILREQGPITLELVLLALTFAFAVGIPLGAVAALRGGGVIDHVATAVNAGTIG